MMFFAFVPALRLAPLNVVMVVVQIMKNIRFCIDLAQNPAKFPSIVNSMIFQNLSFKIVPHPPFFWHDHKAAR